MHLSLTTPRGSVIDADVDEIAAPGAVGEFGVLPGHIPLLAALRPGVFVYRKGDKMQLVAVSEGILQVARTENGGDKVVVLVDRATAAHEIDREAAVKDLASAESDVAAWKTELGADYQVLVRKRDWAAARVEAGQRATPH